MQCSCREDNIALKKRVVILQADHEALKSDHEALKELHTAKLKPITPPDSQQLTFGSTFRPADPFDFGYPQYVASRSKRKKRGRGRGRRSNGEPVVSDS